MGSSGSKAVGGIASNAAKRYNAPSSRTASPSPASTSRSAEGPIEASEHSETQRHVDGPSSLPSWYKQSSYDVLRSHTVSESPGMTINRKPVSEAEMNSVSHKDNSYVDSLHKISHIIQKESMENVMPSMDELRRRRGSAIAGLRPQQPLPQNRRKLIRSIDDAVGNGDEKLFTVAQLKLAMMGGDLGHSAPNHELTLQVWQNVCKFISLPVSELHSAQSRAGRAKVRIGQRSTQ
jgi:hypothetical protein